MLAAVSLVTVLLAASPASAGSCEEEGAVGGTIDVVSWNAWGLPAPIARGRRERLPAASRWLDGLGVDVAGLQEVWKGARNLLTLTGLHLPGLDEGDSGLAIVSPYPVEVRPQRPFADARGIDRLKAKGVLPATVEHPALGPIEVRVTHLQAGGSTAAARVRAKQVDAIVDELDGVHVPVVVMGDFNLYDNQPDDRASARRLADAGLIDTAQALGAEAPTYPGSPERLDRIYARGDHKHCVSPMRAAVLSDARPLSDHLPVAATLGFTSAGTPAP